MFTVGIDVGGTKTAYGLFDAQGNTLEKFRRPSNASLSAPEFFDGIVAEVQALLERRGISPAQVRGVGIGLPSFVEYEKGYVLKTSALTTSTIFTRETICKRGWGEI